MLVKRLRKTKMQRVVNSMADAAPGTMGKTDRFEKTKRSAGSRGIHQKQQHQGRNPDNRFEILAKRIGHTLNQL